MAEEAKIKLPSKEEKQRLLKLKLQQLRNLVSYINGKLPSRQARKQFWRDFVKHEEFQIQLLDKMIDSMDEELIKEP